MKQQPSLENQVYKTLRERRLLDAGDRVFVAVSGGADSVALLFLLLSLREAFGVELMTAHFEHGIRGEASRGDAAFVKKLCDRIGVSCFVESGDVPALSAARKWNVEDAARKARYEFLHRIAVENKANRIALGHHMRDQAETLLLHLARGCGLNGLSGMRYESGMLIRPLLDVMPEELKAYLRERKIQWREDETNDDIRCSRNLLRHNVLPMLEFINPRVCEAMTRTALQAAKAQDALNDHARSYLRDRVKRMPYGAFWLIGDAPPTIDACRLFASFAGIPPLDAAQSEALCTLPVSAVCNLPSGWRALRTRERLHLLLPTRHERLMFEPGLGLAKKFSIETRNPGEVHDSGDCGDGVRTQALDADKTSGAAFRFRQKGDVFAPIGGVGTQKLKQTLRDAGVDRPFRDMLPVLAAGPRVLWIVGLKPSQDAAITSETQRIVKITYQGELPWEI